MPRYDFTIKAGATYPPLGVKCVDENNSAVSLSGAKNVKFCMRKAYPLLSVIANKIGATMTDSVAGEFQFSWSKAYTSALDNTDVQVEFWVTCSDNSILKVPTEGYFLGRIGDSIA